ncbi:hypothetical protein ACWDA7_50110 [Streptomyces sp. NPDC001156]
MADELVTFLCDRLDEDDETARKATIRRMGGEAWSYEEPAVNTVAFTSVSGSRARARRT